MWRGLWVFLIFLIGLPGSAGSENPSDIMVIANSNVDEKTIDTFELKDLFLKKRTNWGSGDKAIPLNALEGSALREDFRSRVLGLSAMEERLYWQERIVKTGVSEPAEFGNTLKAVFQLRGSIGYVYRSQYREGVAKVLLVVPAK